jgi:hypothetical protein
MTHEKDLERSLEETLARNKFREKWSEVTTQLDWLQITCLQSKAISVKWHDRSTHDS